MRPYVQRVRAERSAETHTRILEAVVALVAERGTPDVTLAEVAMRAGVSVQTVLRRFGSGDGLRAEMLEHALRLVREERRSPTGDLAAAVAAVVDQYERRGDAVLALLAHEATSAQVREFTDQGRLEHRRWVERVFQPALHGAAEPDREELTDVLVVATDIATWRLLRRDRGLSRADVEARMRRLVSAVVAHAGGRRG